MSVVTGAEKDYEISQREEFNHILSAAADEPPYRFSRSRYCLRNLATFGAITIWQ